MPWPTIARRRRAAQDEEGATTEFPRFNRHADRLVERHGDRVWRLGIDGGFGCPNREGAEGKDGRGGGGCAYCAPGASRAPYLPAIDPDIAGSRASIAGQVKAAMSFMRRRYGAALFFPYFQAFSSTYAPVDVLAARYEAALSAVEELLPGSLRGLVVSTRPDCVDEEVADLLGSYADRGLEVWVELGLQSGSESTLRRIGRGHTVERFIEACRVLKRPGLRVAAHLILGLPGEDRATMPEGARLVSELRLDGVKFHDLHIPRGSALAGEYLAGELVLLSRASYLEALAGSIALLRPETELVRLCTDSQGPERLAPRRAFDKRKIYEDLEALLAAKGLRQGSAILS